MRREIRIGTRGSDLAMIQARAVADRLRRDFPDLVVSLEVVKTSGDRDTERPLAELSGRGLFIKEIEKALVENAVDLAVHSMKDLPSFVPDGLMIAAVTERAEARDALVSRAAASLDALPEGATLLTGSPRRRSQLLALRPDLRVEGLRGNVPTRLAKLDASRKDGAVLAAAGLERLGLSDRIRSLIPIDVMIPAVGQGALAIEIRSDDSSLRTLVATLNDEKSARAVTAERSCLRKLGGGCQAPIGVHAVDENGSLRVRGYVGSPDGDRRVRRDVSGRPDVPEELGLQLAEELLAGGARPILDEIDAGRG